MRLSICLILLFCIFIKCSYAQSHNEPASTRYKNDNIIIDFNIIVENKNLNTFINELRTNKLKSFYSAKQIPTFAKDVIAQLSKQKFSMADPGKDWQCCDAVTDPDLPGRILVYGGSSKNLLALVYLTGGVGTETHLVLIKHNDALIKNFWTGTALKEIHDQRSLIKYLSTIRGRKNYIYINKGSVDI